MTIKAVFCSLIQVWRMVLFISPPNSTVFGKNALSVFSDVPEKKVVTLLYGSTVHPSYLMLHQL